MKSISPGKLRSLFVSRPDRPGGLRPLGVSLARFSSALAVCGALLAGVHSGKAVTLSWDPDGDATNNKAATQIGLGGSGTWDLSSTRWWDPALPLNADQIWPNTILDTAVFGGALAPSAVSTVTLGSPVSAAGLTFTTSGYALVQDFISTLTLAAAATPVIAGYGAATIGTLSTPGIAGTQGFTKTGGGALVVQGQNTGLSGRIILAGGTLTSTNGNVSDGQTSSLGSGDFQLNTGTLNLLNNGTGSNLAAPIAYGNNLIINGNSAILVNNAGGNNNNAISVATLSLNNSQLTISNGNNYGFVVAGGTTLSGPLSTLNTGMTQFQGAQADPNVGLVALIGAVTGSGPLNKAGTGTVTLKNAGNTYSGGTNILAGGLLLNTAAANLGTGNVIVNAGANLGVTTATNLTLSSGKTLALASASNSLAVLRVDANNNVITGTAASTMFISPYGASFQINGNTSYSATGDILAGTIAGSSYSQNLDLSAIGSSAPGNGKIIFGSTNLTNTQNGIYTGILTSASDNIFRLGAGGSATTGQLVIAAANALNDTRAAGAQVVIGSPINNIQTITNGTQTVQITAPQNFTGNVTINKGSTLAVPNATAQNLLGTTGTINILGGTLDTTASNYTGPDPQLGNAAVNLYQGGTLALNNSGVTVAGGAGSLRLGTTTALGLYSGTFTFTGSNTAATTSTQTFETTNFSGGNIVNVTASATATGNADAEVIFFDFNRNGAATVAFARPGTTQPANFGLSTASTDSRVRISNLNGAPPAPGVTASLNGMLAPYLADESSKTFLTYGANGIAPVTYDDLNFAAPAANKVEDVTATAAPGNVNVYALRIGGLAGAAFGLTGTNTITIVGNPAVGNTDGAGLLLNTITTAQANTPNIAFGTSGSKEAIIYATGGQNNTLSGAIAATGLTKFGPSPLLLTGTNTGLTGTITVNQGILNGTAVALNFRPVTLNAGTLQINNAASLFLNDVTVLGDSTLDTGTNLQQRIQSITVAPRIGATDPITFNIIAGGAVVNGTTTLNGPVNLNATAGGNQNIFGNPMLGSAALTGTGALNKWGGGQVVLASSSPAYSGVITVNGSGGNNNNNVLRSQAAATADKPFGTGAITVNPGGVLSLANPANTSSNPSVTLNSDLNGLATIAMSYNGAAALPTVTAFNNTNLGGPFSAVLSVDAVGFSGDINLNTFGGGRAFLGSSNQTGNYTGNLIPSTVGLANSLPGTGLGSPYATPTSTGVYRIGAGGGTTQFLGGPGQFAAGNDIQVGAINNVHQFTSVSLANGNGNAAIYNVNAGFNGKIVLNGSTNTLSHGNLLVGNNNSLGSGTIIFNGGGIQADASTGLPFNNSIRTLSNSLVFAGDVVFNGATDLKLTANVGLADGQTGVTRTINVVNTTGLTIFSGNISDGSGGAATNSITKTGAGPLVFTGSTTYSGYTNLNAGTIVVASDTDISPNSQIILGGGALGVWNSSFTTDRNYIITATSNFDVGAAKTLTQSINSNLSGTGSFPQKVGLGTLVLNGINSNSNGTASWNILNGILAVSSNVNLGDPVGNSTVFPQGGTFRALDSFVTPRSFNTNNTGNGGIDVVPTKTLTITGVVTSTAGFIPTKTGLGTVVSTGANTNVGLTTEAGTWQAGNNLPFATTALLNFNGGTFAFQNTGAAAASQAVTTSGNATFGGGGHLLLQHQGTGFSTQFTTTGAFARIAVGTLVIDALSPLGVAGNDAVRFIPTNLHGVARASAVNNGIFAPNIITADSGGLGNFLVNDATNGLKPWDFTTPAAVTTLSGLQPAAIGNITAPQTITGTNNRIYAFRTNSDVLAGVGGGTLRVVSINGTTNEGGILVNANVNFGANLIFDPTATTGGSATSGEGLFYVAPGATATLNGNVLGTAFTKFGTGNVIFAGTNNAIFGALAVQEGTLQLASSAGFGKFQTDLVLNNQGTLDLNGGKVRFFSLANSAAVTGGIAGGLIGSSSASPGTFTISGATSTTFGGRIVDGGIGAGTGVTSLVKSGTSTLTLAPFSVNNPEANVNTFTGGTTINLGSLIVQDPRGLGTGAINLVGGTLNLQSNGGGINGTIILGNQAGIGSTVNLRGPATINVDRPSANSGNSWQIGALNLTENTLTVTGGNSYHLRVNGQTSILGNYANLTTGTNGSSGTMEIAGQITGSGALNKFGADVSRALLIDNPTNSYSGGTNIQSGALSVNATSGTPLGAGRVNVFPGAMLRLAGVDTPANGWTAATIGGAPLRVHGYFNSLGFVALDNDDFDPTAVLSGLSSAYGTMGVGITRPFYTRTLDQSALGDGRTFLTGGMFTDVSYIAPTLAPGLGDGIAPRVYRLAGGPTTSNLVFPGADNVLNDTSAAGTSVQIGSPTSIVVGSGVAGTVGTALNFVIVRNSNNYTGGTIVWKGSGLQIETGASSVNTSKSPLGSGPVDVWGTLQTSGQNGSFVDGNSAGPVVNRNTITLHPGGQITINDVAGNVTGGQGRWADGTGINLSGGTFQLTGANGYASIETIGTVTVDKGSRIIVSRAANAGTAALVVNDLVRTTASGSPGNGNGTLLIASQAAGSLGIPASTTVTNVAAGSYDRLIVSNPTSAAIALVGKTSIGAGVTAGIAAAGVAPAWIINTTDNTFVTYSPTTGTNSGYQGLVSAGSAGASVVAANGTFTPGANQVGFSKVITTGLEGGANPIQLVAGDTVDMTSTALTLGDNPTIHALRTAVNISASGTNNTLTITGGGLIGVNNLTIGVAPTTGVGNMTLNFGAGGSAEGLLYQVNNATMTINAQIGASALTFFSTRGANDVAIALTASNPNLTGPVTINQGRVNLANTLSGLGTPVAGMLNNQNVYIGGAGATNASTGAIRVLLTGTVGTASTSILPSGVNSTTLFGTGTWFINGDAQIDNNSSAYLQRLNNLTFPDLGAGKPIELTNTGLSIPGTTTLGSATSTIFLNTTFGNPGGSVLGGLVTGGRLVKYGNGGLLLAGTANNYASTVINQSTVNTATSIVGSLTRTGTPFGSGPITVNPGGELRVMAPGNISGNAVTLKSDGVALAGIGISANITPAALATLLGTLTMTTTGDFGGVVSLDANNWNSALSLTALDAASNSGKHLWLGSSMNPIQTYFNTNYLNYNAATLTPASDNVIRIGGGGNQGSIALGVGQFENVLSGNADLQIGAVTAGINANGPMYINGNIGQLLLNTRNLAFTGSVEVNVGGQLTIGNANALVNASAINMEGGNLGVTNAQTLKTPINVVGDTFGYVGGSAFDNVTLAGAINLAPGGAGGTRTFNFNAAGTGITGIISGGPGSNIIRVGGASVIFHANNTYQGTTTINAELLYAGTDVSPNATVAGAFGMSDTPILLGNAGGNSAGKLGIAGQFTFGRDIIATGASGNQYNLIRSQSLQTSVITGGINTQSATIGGGLALDAISTAGGVGGVLDIQGPIVGVGAIQIGGGGQAIVRLSASSNGLGINTYSGSTNIWGGRVQVNAETNFTGLPSAATVISGPFGTGTLYLGRQGTTTGGVANQAPTFVQIDAFGADRTIVNTLGSINQNGDTTINFGAHNSLTFTSGMDTNSDGTLRIRTLNVLTSQGAVTFSGGLSASGAAFARITKTGAGTLLLTGPNTINYAAAGNPLAVNAGVLQFNTDANLGAVSTTAHTINLGGGTLQPAAAGTVLWAAASSNRALNLTAASFTNVSDPAGIFQLDTAVTGAFGLTKLGAGILRLNATGNAFTNLTLGGVPIGGGTVSTTAATGTPFGTAASTITLNSGVLSLIGGASAQAITTASLEFRGGAYVQLNKGTTGSQLTATALTRGTTVPGGTLTLLPSALATLGSAAAATSENMIAGNAATVFPNNTGGDTLAIPVVQTRLAGTAQPASFVRYGTNGFQLSTNANTGVLTANNPTLVASVPGGTVGTGANLSVLGLITTGSIGQTDASPLYIANGGLIINGTSGAQISANLVFGDVARAATAASGAATFTLGAGTNADLQVGELVTGPGILPGTTIATLPSYPTGNTFTTNFNTTAAVTTLNTVKEALVYVQDGQSTVSSIGSGGATPSGFTAANFTKSGPGTLLIGGSTNVMAPFNSGVGLRVLQINEGAVQFAGQSSLPSGGVIFVNPMDNGTLDLNGQSLSIAGLGVGTSVAGPGTGNVTSSTAATLTLNGNNLATQFNGVISGNISLVKSGTGTQILGASTQTGLGGNTFAGVGGTTINAGNITSATGIFTPLGTLQVKGVNSLGTGGITLAGGILEFNNAIAANEVYTNIIAVLQGGNNGYDITVPALNSLGSPNTTSQFATNSTVAWQAINSLTVNAPVLTFAGGSAFGTLVKGTTTFNQDTILNVTGTGQALFAGTLSAPGKTLTKIGPNTLFLTGTGGATNGTGGAANNVGAWNILAGTVEVRNGDGGSNPLGGTTITLNAGTLNLRDDGDNLGDPQNISTYNTDTLVIGSLAPISSANYIDSANSVLDTRTLNAGANKTIQLAQLQFGGPLGTAFLSHNAANNYTIQVTGGLTMIKDAYLAINSTPFTIDTQLSGNGTLYKQGGNELDINTVATNTGGTVLAAGTTNFASFQGNTRMLSTTAKLGAGGITLQPGALIRFNGTSNVNGGQVVDLRSNLSNYAVIGIGEDSVISGFNLRVPQAAGAFSNNMATALNTGAGVLAINAVYSKAINLNTIGDGGFFLGSNNSGAGIDSTSSVNGTITGTVTPSLVKYNFGPANSNNSNAVYRLGGGGAFLNIGLLGGGTSPLADSSATVKSSVVVGGPLTNSNNTVGGATIGNATGTVFLNTPQTYTGNTLVNRNSTLEVRAAMATSGYEAFGTLAAGGNGGTFATGPVPVVRPGGTLRLDNSLDLLPVTATQGRWADSTAVNLDSSTFQLTGNAAADLTEVVGAINVAGGSTLTARTMLAGRISEINAGSIVRTINNNSVAGNNGQLSIQPVNGTQLGTNERVTATTIANYAGTQVTPTSAVQNGMVVPWMVNVSENQFLTYSDFGFVNAGFNLVNVGGTLAASTGTGTERLLIGTATATLPLGGVLNVWGLRPDTGINLATATDATATVTIGSGGIIDSQSISITPKVVFGSLGTPTDALISVNGNTLTIGDITNRTTSGQIVATNIAKTGAGTLSIDSTQPAFTGHIAINGGAVTLRDNQSAAGPITSQIAGSGAVGAQNIIFNGFNATLNLRSDVNGVLNLNQNLVISPGNPQATINVDRIAANATVFTVLGALNLGGAPGDQGQALNLTTNNASLQIVGTTTLGAAAGNIFFDLTGGTNTTLAGLVTGPGTMIRNGSGSGLLVLGPLNAAGTALANPTASNTFTGGIVIQSGTLQASATAAANSNVSLNALGANNNINLVGGQLNLRVDQTVGATVETATFNNNSVTMTGNATISVDRVGVVASTNKLVAVSQLNIGGQTLTVTAGNTYGLQFNNVALTSTPTFNNSADLILKGVTDSGAGLFVVKNGTGSLWFADSSNTYSGGTYVNQGNIRFGTPLAVSTTAKTGTGNITLNPGAGIILEALTNLNAGQQIDVRSVPSSLGVFRTTSILTQAQLQSTLTGTSTGLLVAGVAYTTALDLATIGDGTFQFANAGDFTYTPTTLGAGAGNLYRLGGNGQNFRITTGNNNVLTDVTVATPGRTVAGPTRLQVGSLASGGAALVFNNTNNYTGGTSIIRGAQANFATGLTNTPMGSGQVDVFGTLVVNGTSGSFLNAGSTANNNVVVLHPGASLQLGDTATNNNDRWHDGTGIALDGTTLVYGGGATGTETVGAITFARGSRITVNNGTNPKATLTQGLGSPTRIGAGTLAFNADDASFGTNGTNTDNFVFTGAAPATANGMLPAYIVNARDNTFMNVSGQFFLNATDTLTIGANFNTGLTAGTDRVLTNANTTLTDNPVIYALRTPNNISNAPGQFNTITLSGSGTGGGLLLTGNGQIIAPNVKFGPNGEFEAPIYIASGVTANFTGDISATGITKFGTGVLQINKDQSTAARGVISAVNQGFASGWTINEGQVTANVFGALGDAVATNPVTLNGSNAGAAILRLQANQANLGLAYYSMGDLNVVDNGSISYDPAADDRTQALGAAGALSNILVTSTGGTSLDAQLLFGTNRSRTVLTAGDLIVSGTNAGALLNVGQSAQTNFLTSGSSSGLSVASLKGTADQRIDKWGNAVLYVRGASTFAGAINIEQGVLQIANAGGLGDASATNIVTVKRYGTLDLNTAGFNRTDLIFQSGSILRLTADNALTGAALTAGGLNLGGGTLQVANDQTQTTATAITMNGGSIEGFLRTDDLVGTTQALYRTLGSNVTFNFAGNSFVGQNINQGVNGLDNGRPPTVFTPLANSAAGVLLEIKGAISGPGSLTKQGYDTVTVSGANAYAGGTNVVQGMLRIGATNSLPTAGDLSTTGAAVFDLNGFNQTVARLTSPATGATAATTNLNGSGFITNTATTTNVLTVGASADAIYSGVIQYNVALTKSGTNVQTLTNFNTYTGPTTVTAGVLEVSGSVSGTSKADINGGTLAGAESSLAPGTTALAGGPVNVNNGGTFSPGAAGATAGVGNIGTFNAGGGLSLTGGGTLKIDLQSPYVSSLSPGVNDRVNVTGTISLAGSNALSLNLVSYTPVFGDLFFIALNDGNEAISGTAAALGAFPDAGFDVVIGPNGQRYAVSLTGDQATGAFTSALGNDIALMVVPEPSSWAMLLASFGATLGLQRFRRRRV
jgi:autotransporter-associated beta strand protein